MASTLTGMPFESLNHISLVTRRLSESRRFYREVLGFREVQRPNFDFNGAWLFKAGFTIHLIENLHTPAPGGEINLRGNRFALHSSDLAGVLRVLDERHIEYRKKTIADTGIVQIFFRDPDGHHIEIGDYPPTPPFLDA